MAELFNIYRDESCHLEQDASLVMVLGAVWCPASKSHAISERIREIKTQHGLSPSLEIKAGRKRSGPRTCGGASVSAGCGR